LLDFLELPKRLNGQRYLGSEFFGCPHNVEMLLEEDRGESVTIEMKVTRGGGKRWVRIELSMRKQSKQLKFKKAAKETK